ncbi:MAG: AMP-binding protein, partial [Clostridiales Family XIII bacterium]|nr:AMP-binding protein [Clostridiales Family XIII bacterium]
TFRRDVTELGTAFMDLGLHGKHIAVIGENRYEWVVTYLATVCGVGVIVPIDRELTAEEIAHLLTRAGASALVYSGKMEKTVAEAVRLSGGVDFLISMDAAESEEGRLSFRALMSMGMGLLREGRREYLRTEIDPHALSSLIFTSGTTGLAKGVMLSHHNLVSNVIGMHAHVNVGGLTVLDVLPMHHTYEFTCGILGAMYQGCTIAICEGLKYIVKNMAECKANVILGVPLIFEKMHQKVWKQAEASGKAKRLRRAIALSKAVGGEKLARTTKRVFKNVHQALGGEMRLVIAGGAACDPIVISDFNAMGIRMIQGYGMTENAPIIAVNKDRCSKDAAAGLPMPGTEIRIDEPDEDGIGEIVYRSPSVMLGYYKDPDETAKVLRDGWLYSGDYGYLDADGFLFITGRKKHVIVTKNGKNIFPEEVEYYLQQSPYIAESVVWGKDEAAIGDTVICAEIFPDFETLTEHFGEYVAKTEEELTRLIDREVDKANAKMPAYKRVKRFSLRDTEFEKTTTKKIKRHVLGHARQDGTDRRNDNGGV